MCGIIGIVAKEKGTAPSRELFLSARDSMRSRGPDADGLWVSADETVYLGHRRLAILDLSPRGVQPMWDGSKSCVIVFNGEIFNFWTLRKELEQEGVEFQSDSDTEVLLELYARHGVESFAKLRGMYSLAIWDTRREIVVLHRDSFGIKPLYYSVCNGKLMFASQVRALLQFPELPRNVCSAAISSFLLLGSVAEPDTIVEGIRMLPPGAVISMSRSGELTESRLDPLSGPATVSVGAALRESVSAHLLSDTPCGFFLSAGLDSSLLVAAAVEAGHAKLHTVTVGFEEFRGTAYDETLLAKKVANVFNTTHDTVWVTKDEYSDLLESLFSAMDQPSIDGLNTLVVSRAARAAGLTVALSGLGGDEFFSGYPSFAQIPQMLRWCRPIGMLPGLGQGSRRFVAWILNSAELQQKISPKYAGVLEYSQSVGSAYLLRRALFMPWEVDELFSSGKETTLALVRRLCGSVGDFKSENINRQVSSLELSWYTRNQLLRDTDWASMAHSLEVRVPFLDAEVFRSTRAGEHKKSELVAELGQKLPAEITMRPKTGFVVPLRECLAEVEPQLKQARGLRGWAQYVLCRYAETHRLSLPELNFKQ